MQVNFPQRSPEEDLYIYIYMCFSVVVVFRLFCCVSCSSTLLLDHVQCGTRELRSVPLVSDNHIYVYIYIHEHIYIERERERKRERDFFCLRMFWTHFTKFSRGEIQKLTSSWFCVFVRDSCWRRPSHLRFLLGLSLGCLSQNGYADGYVYVIYFFCSTAGRAILNSRLWGAGLGKSRQV